MRLLVTGAAGMLGHAVMQVARDELEWSTMAAVRNAEHASLLRERNFDVVMSDITSDNDIERTLAHGFDAVINCAGITKARSDNDPVETIRVNSLGPHLLARQCATRGVRLIQVSTDCVFSGHRGNYSEHDTPDPVDLYGRTKLLGEVAIPGVLTVRTSFIGRELLTRAGLLEWFLRQRGKVTGYTCALWSGLTTQAVSRVLCTLASRRAVDGILNVGGETIDKYRLLCLLKEAFAKQDIEIEPSETPIIDRSLDCRRLRELGIQPPALRKMIHEMARTEA